MFQKIFKIIFLPITSFRKLPFERKCLLLITLAILIGIAFYCWDVWEKQMYFKEQSQWWNEIPPHK